MVVHLLGKEHLEGVSKSSGKPYSFDKVYVAFSQPHVDGQAVRDLMIPSNFDFSRLVVGQHYNFDFDMTGRLVGVSAAKV